MENIENNLIVVNHIDKIRNNYVRHFNLTVCTNSNESLKKGALSILKELRDNWDPEEICFKYFQEGITNHLIGCYLRSNPKDVLLVRVYGERTELFIDRAAETRNMYLMHKAGLSPPLYLTFNNGLSYGFSPGETLNDSTVKDKEIGRLIAQMMARMHSVKPTNGSLIPKPCLFTSMKKFLSLIPLYLDKNGIDPRYSKISRQKLEDEVDSLKPKVLQIDSPVVFCHNDLLLKNIIYNKEKDTVSFIDFEYADYNYQGFDIGNHFCEYAGVDSFDPSKFPDKSYQLKWLKNYLKFWYEECGRSPLDVTDTDVEVFYVQVNVFALIAHLFWSLWAIVQSLHSNIDFDYLGYALQRLDEYYAKKEEVFSLQMPK